MAIAAGKGGVGKSVISSNLAIACAQQGRRVVLIDGDLGAPNLHTLLGVGRVRGGLDAFFGGDIARLADAVADTGIPGLGLIVGAVRSDAADLDTDERRRMLAQVRSLDADVVILDIGAGTSRNAIEMFLAADHRLVVMVPQLPALQNAYLFLKASVLQTIHAVGGEEVDEVLGGEGGTVASGLARLRNARPGLADRVGAALAGHGIGVVGNMVTDPHELATIEAMVRMVRDYLTLHVPVVGSVKASPAVRASIDERKPLLLDPSAGRIAVELRRIAATVLESAPASARLIGDQVLPAVDDDALRDAEPVATSAELAAHA